MSSLGPEARALLDDADGVGGATRSDKERIRARLALRIGLVTVGAVTAGSAASGPGSAVASATVASAGSKAAAVAGTTGITLVWKLIGAVGVAGALAAGVAAVRHDNVSSRAAAPLPTETPGGIGAVGAVGAVGAAPSVEAVVSPSEPTPGPSTTTSPSGELTTSAVSAVSAVSSVRGPRLAGVPSPVTSGPRAGGAVASGAIAGPSVLATAEGEAALLRNAEAAVAAGDGVGALALLETHARRFPDGALADQRDAERVVALCTVGRVPAAREAATRFLASHPRSSRADRVRRACGTP